MGVLNLTPDSFSDGGVYADDDAAVRRAMQMVNQGAAMIDVGGESTRPGAARVSAQQQIARTAGVIARIRKQLDRAGHRSIVISIDTTLSPVAQAALDAGAGMINDVSAGRDDGRVLTLAAQAGVPVVLMHMRGDPADMQDQPEYQDVVGEVHAFLQQRVDAAQQAGVEPGRIIIDPGIGFGKTLEHNLQLLAHLDQFVSTGYPVLLGTSRKRFMRTVCGAGAGDRGHESHAPGQSGSWAAGTCATTTIGVGAGVAIFRVHDVLENRQGADVAWAIHRARGG